MIGGGCLGESRRADDRWRELGAGQWRPHVQGRINMADAPRTVLISGCSSGIGLELAVQLAQDPRRRYHGEGSGGGEDRPGKTGVGMASQDPSALPALVPLVHAFSCLGELGENPEHREPPFPPLLVNHPPSKESF